MEASSFIIPENIIFPDPKKFARVWIDEPKLCEENGLDWGYFYHCIEAETFIKLGE